jgi:hypothetical protein
VSVEVAIEPLTAGSVEVLRTIDGGVRVVVKPEYHAPIPLDLTRRQAVETARLLLLAAGIEVAAT